MKIHHSSLTFSPLGLNQNIGRNTSEKNNVLPVAKDAQNKKFKQPSSSEDIKKTLVNSSLDSDFTSNNIIKPTDSRTLRALSAYHQAFNAPMQDQRAQLITGIDTYA